MGATLPQILAEDFMIGGPDRDRTGDLIVANDALSQLSYRPIGGENCYRNFIMRPLVVSPAVDKAHRIPSQVRRGTASRRPHIIER